MRTKLVKDIANIIADIYKVGPLTHPKVFQCDNGSEFKRGVTKLLEKHGVMIQHVTTKYHNIHMAFVDALNKLLAEQLFKVQDPQELNDPEKVSSTWVKHLYGLVNQLNDTETQMTGMKSKDAIELKEVPQGNQENYPSDGTLPEDGFYQYLLQLSKEHNDQWTRAMDGIWSKKTCRLSKVTSSPGNWVMYHLCNGPDRDFAKEELMRIPQNTELLPD